MPAFVVGLVVLLLFPKRLRAGGLEAEAPKSDISQLRTNVYLLDIEETAQ